MGVGTIDKPAAEIDCSPELLRGLLELQAPEHCQLPITPVGQGWDNAMFRLGDDLVARLPRRALAAQLILHEQRWLPELGPRLRLPVPVPLVCGIPQGDYPWHWSVSNWIEGEPALAVIGQRWLAEPVGEFLAGLHVPAPTDAPRNPHRGIPLSERGERQQRWARELGSDLDPRVTDLWSELIDTPSFTGADVWVHGDMHPLNILVRSQTVSGVIDFGDLTSGDPASDLAVGWMLLDSEGRKEFTEAAGPRDEATWQRARAWAIALGTAFLMHSRDDPRMRAIAEHTLEQVLLD